MFRQTAVKVFLGSLASYEAGLLEEKYNKKEDFIEDPLLQMSMGPLEYIDGDIPRQRIDFEKYKNLFYTRKLKIADSNQEDIETLCDNYLRGLQWVLTYYKKGMPDWNWSYSEFYAPFLCDLAKTAGTSQTIADGMVFTINEPV